MADRVFAKFTMFEIDPKWRRRDDGPRVADKMVKQRRWYGLAEEERARIMRSHIEVGRRHPEITVNTSYSFGLDDQEFVVAFEGDDPGEFLDLVHELRPSESSEYTEPETPIFTCVAMSARKALDAIDGAHSLAAAGS